MVGAKAAYAYDRQITGKGVTIAILDTGIDRDNPEFAGRISPDSKSFESRIARCGSCPGETINFELDDVQGHGTMTTSVAAAAADGKGVQGLAPEATILALKIAGPDMTDVTATSIIKEGDSANVASIAPAMRYAVDKGAVVMSMSVNGFSSGQLALDQRAAMDYVRSNNRLFVQSITNFTGEDSFTGQISENLAGSDLANKEWMLFGIRVDASLQPPSGNGLPGPVADRTLAVVASNVQATTKDGGLTSTTGNSFAAPAIAGAAALLKQYWPQLGGKEIAAILLSSATDLGAPGVDQVFGAGLLNVEAAMKAQAPAAAVAAAEMVLARYSSITTSSAFSAAALDRAVAGMTVIDRYGRDYRMSGAGVARQGSGLLAGTMLGQAAPLWLATTANDVRLGLTSNALGLWQAASQNRPAVVAFSPKGGQMLTLGANIALGHGMGIADAPLRSIAPAMAGSSARWTDGAWTASYASGRSRDRRSALNVASVATPTGLGVEIAELIEQGQTLGLRGDMDMGSGTARTRLATLVATKLLGNVSFSGRATVGVTTASKGSGLLRFDRELVSSAFALDAGHDMLGGVTTVRLSSPLKLERANATVLAPLSYDLMTGRLVTGMTPVDLAPTSRELDLEFGWAAALSETSSVRFGIARAFNAGHVAGVQSTAGFASLVVR